jgi:hypothetical protein
MLSFEFLGKISETSASILGILMIEWKGLHSTSSVQQGDQFIIEPLVVSLEAFAFKRDRELSQVYEGSIRITVRIFIIDWVVVDSHDVVKGKSSRANETLHIDTKVTVQPEVQVIRR